MSVDPPGALTGADDRAEVLIVDDDPTTLLLAREMLGESGFRIVEADSGERALSLVARRCPDLVLLDVGLPGIDGFEVCQRLRQIADAAHLPIVMVTGHDDLASISRAYEVGATDFIAKPINWPILGHHVRYVLRGAATLRQLRAAEARNAAMLRAIPDMMFKLRGDATLLDYKPAAGITPLVPPEQFLGRRLDEVLPEGAARSIRHALDEAMQSGETRACQYLLAEPQGERHYEARLVRVDADEALGLVRDITTERQAQAQMREALVVFNASTQGIMTTDPAGIITAINPAFCAITGFSREEVIGHRSSVFKSGRHDAAFFESMWATLQRDGTWEGEIWNRRKDGQIYPQWSSITAVRDSEGRIIEYVSLFSDISLRKQQEEAIWRQANFDALTGLANRSLFLDRLERALAHTRRSEHRLGLIFLDLDGFKWINDSLGHDAGDLVLTEAARRLRHSVRDQDTVARLGGDEFTIIIHDLSDGEDLVPICDKIVETLRQPFMLDGNAYRLSGSVGVTVFPDDGADVATLLKNADMAMYKAKQAGKNRYRFFARNMQADVQARQQLGRELKSALSSHAIGLAFQPIVDADSGELVGAEALVRWQHPSRGAISPLEFIPVAEDCGMVGEIDAWALGAAAKQLRRWLDAGHGPLQLTVNLSGPRFRDPALPGEIDRVVREFRLPPGSLMIDVGEAILTADDDSGTARLHDLAALGIARGLDSFGNDPISSARLKLFPVDLVKIDRRNVRNCTETAGNAAQVEAIVGTAHSLGLQVSAIGVETTAQLDFLRDIGCDRVQGFLVGTPVSGGEFEAVIERRFLLPRPLGSGNEETRLLAALRSPALDIEAWLRRLLQERAPEVAAACAGAGWVCAGLDLRAAVQAHLDWRTRLEHQVRAGHPGEAMSAEEAASTELCQLGRWIAEHPELADGNFIGLHQVHRDFHELAGRVVAELRLGHRSSARRRLGSFAFRVASRDIIVALVESFLIEVEARRGNAAASESR